MALYRHSIKFQDDNAADSVVDPDYQDHLTGVPAAIVPKGGGEIYRGVLLQAQTTNVIECRYISGLLPNMIIIDEFTKTNYTINKMLNVGGRNREWMIEAIEVVV